MYQVKSIINKYGNTDKKFQIKIPPNQGLKSSMENLKGIMIGKLKNYWISEIKYEIFRKINIFWDNVLRFSRKLAEWLWRQRDNVWKFIIMKPYEIVVRFFHRIFCEIVSRFLKKFKPIGISRKWEWHCRNHHLW